MLIRTNSGHLYESYSNDGGKTWQHPQPTQFISSDSPAAILRLRDGRIILFWCCDQSWDNPNSYANGGRQVLHAAISNDDGKGWIGFREVLIKPTDSHPHHGDFGASYSSAVETTDRKVALISGQGAGRSIVLFDPNWLEQSSAKDDFSNGLTQWTMFGGDSATCVSSLPAKKNRKVLWVRKSVYKKYLHTEAEWNFPMMIKGEMLLKIRKNRGSTGIDLALTNNFSTCNDTLANKHATFYFSLDGNKSIWRGTNKDIKIRIKWDVKNGKGWLYLNKELVSITKIQNQSHFGVNYLRIGIPGNKEDMAGYYVKSIKVIPTK